MKKLLLAFIVALVAFACTKSDTQLQNVPTGPKYIRIVSETDTLAVMRIN